MLRHEIEKLLPEARIVGLVAAVDAFHAQETCDLIISTAPIKSIVPAIVVHPILTDDDRKYILNHRLVRHFWRGGLADMLFESLRKYVDKKNYDAVKREIQHCLQGANDSISLETEFQPGSIVEKYLDSIISQTMYYGTYMFINSDVMLAHAKPQDGVNHLANAT